MGKTKKKGISFKQLLMLFAMVPVIVTVLILTIMVSLNAKKSLETEVKRALQVASYDLREYYQDDLIN